MEKYHYRGRAKKTWYYPVEEWIYFKAYSDSDAGVVFKSLTGLSKSNGDEVEIEGYDTDFKFWSEVVV